MVIVFGAAVRPDGQPSGALRRRLLHGVALWRRGTAPILLVTGGLGRYPPSEARVMHNLAVTAGVPAEQIVTEDASTSTFASALACADIMRTYGWRRAVVVSDAYHVRRAALVLRAFDIEVSTSSAPGGREANRPWQWGYYVVRDGIALPVYVLRIALERFRRRWRGSRRP